MIEHQHAHWPRLSATPHAVRSEAERRCQGMPIASNHRERSHCSSIMSGVAFGGGYITHDPWFAAVGLLMAAVAVTQFVWSRRSL